MRPFKDSDFPVLAVGNGVRRRHEQHNMLLCVDDSTAAEIAKRLNRDNQVYPEESQPRESII